MAAHVKILANNLASVRQRIADATKRSGRQADCVTLVAVTKYVDTDITRRLVDAGCSTLGESRPQELWRKAETLKVLPVEWHMIGHLQRNKIRRSLPFLACVQSVDSVRLLDSLQEEARQVDRRLRILLEVNIARDVEKTGFLPEQLLPLTERLDQWDQLDISGLMAMSGRLGDRDAARRDFIGVRELRDRMQQTCPSGVRLDHLSMGMSGDYTIAVEEGATIVRVGSALFEGVQV